MGLCVICGKEYSRDVTKSHLEKEHGLTREEYNEKKAMLSDAVWNFYWSHAGLREKFPNPLATQGEDGRMTFIEWVNLPKVQNKYKELRG
jgi:hypothetical protein